MRQDQAGSKLTDTNREPRIVIGIIYPFGSVYVTNRANSIANVPGNVVHGALQDVSASSQELFPDEGRATIGSLSFAVVDLAGALTDEFRDQLLNFDNGLGRREVRVFTGDTDDFTDGTWRRVETYVIDSSVEYDRGSYRFSCSDIQRELRQRIFTQNTTRLTADLAEGDTTLNVESTARFEMLEHTAAFTDAQGITVGYVTVKKTGEVIRYTGKTDTSFTGCTRAVFNTRAQAVDVDETAEVDRRPELEECVYLELPAPQLIYALMTGEILDTAIQLPESWHLGISTAFVDADLFRQIGTDLYDPASFSAGFVLRFSSALGLKETDGKRFIEEQIHVPSGTFCPISAEGKLGLRRLVRTLADAAPSVILGTDNIVDHGPLTHRVGDVVNRMIIRWNHDGEGFTREDVLVNNNSIAEHGIGRTVEIELLGLFVARHTRTVLERIRDWFTDRYGAPPQELDLTLLPSMNLLEVGDPVRVVIPGVRDYAGSGDLNRSFEIQSRQMNWQTGDLSTRAFGSTRETLPDLPVSDTTPLDDAWYSSEGVALSTVLTIVADHVTTNGDIPGNADLRAGVYYHLGDLTIDAGVTVTLNGNVQLRVLGAPTVNGKFDGKGRGQAAIVDPNVVSSVVASPVTADLIQRPTLGSTQGSAGLQFFGSWRAVAGVALSGVGAIARPALSVESGALVGLPSELRGTPGIYGGPVASGPFPTWTVSAKGGAGGASGAGLLIVSRGPLAFGVAGVIDLSGADGTAATGPVSVGGHNVYAGAGGGGAPGGLLVLLDGDIPFPALASAFTALHGATPQLGNGLELTPPSEPPAEPWTGLYPGLGSFNLFESARLVIPIPREAEVGDSADEGVPVPQDFDVFGSDVGLDASWRSPSREKHDIIQVFEAISNDRSGAVLVFQGLADSFFKTSATTVTRYLWIRAGRTGVGYSEWSPSSSTGGLVATYGGPTGLSMWTPILSTDITRIGQRFVKSTGTTAWNAGFYSAEAYDACHITARPDQTNMHGMIALNSDPATDHGYTTLDHALYCTNAATLQIYENGVLIQQVGAYSTTDQLRIAYDGQKVRYYRNSDLLWVTPRLGARLYADSSFYDVGMSFSGVAYGPLGAQLAVTDEIRDDFVYTTLADFNRKWAYLSGAASTNISFISGLTDSPSGRAIQIGPGLIGYYFDRLVPYDGLSLYEIGCTARRISGSGSDFFLGAEAVATDGRTPLDTTGGSSHSLQYFVAASYESPPSTWTTYRGYLRGYSGAPSLGAFQNASTPGVVYTGSVYIRPIFFANTDGASTVQIASIWIRRLSGALSSKNSVDTPEIALGAISAVSEVFDAGPINVNNIA